MLQNCSAFSGYSVNNQQEALNFYRDTLGLNVEDNGMGLGLNLNGTSLFLYEKENHIPATFTVLNFQVDNIEKAVDELKARGVEFERYDSLPAPQDERNILRGLTTNDGPDIAWFKDPAGNILSVLQES